MRRHAITSALLPHFVRTAKERKQRTFNAGENVINPTTPGWLPAFAPDPLAFGAPRQLTGQPGDPTWMRQMHASAS